MEVYNLLSLKFITYLAPWTVTKISQQLDNFTSF